jgi:hypothetical protein
LKYMLVRHKVADFDAWKKVFDSHADAQRESGMALERLMRNTEDPNEIFLLLTVTDSEAAHAFVNSPDAEKGAEAAGVLDEPDCWYLD